MKSATDALEQLSVTQESSGNVTTALELAKDDFDMQEGLSNGSSSSPMVVLLNGEQDIVQRSSIKIATSLKSSGATVYSVSQGSLQTTGLSELASQPSDSHIVMCQSSQQLTTSSSLIAATLKKMQGMVKCVEH